jgi:3-phenylpropionate/trans-cinnamate dioxygenase ferredoxin subunit
MAWIAVARVGEVDELAPLAMQRLAVAERKLLLCHGQSGYFCIDEMCTHEDYSLAFGCVRDDRIKCSLHGSWFDLASGQALNEPAECALRTYPVKIEAGQVWVEV